MSILYKLRLLLLCAALQMGTLMGAPMKPEDIRNLLQNMNAPKQAQTLKEEQERERPK